MIENIKKKLSKQFKPDYLEVIDDSLKHKGHIGYVEGKITHLEIKIGSKEFNRLSKISIHRQINNVLKEEWNDGIHSISIKLL